jgi:hypothetical protein
MESEGDNLNFKISRAVLCRCAITFSDVEGSGLADPEVGRVEADDTEAARSKPEPPGAFLRPVLTT